MDSLPRAFPSLVEGFGLPPPLEPMAIGCPVIVSDRASLPIMRRCGDLCPARLGPSLDRGIRAIAFAGWIAPPLDRNGDVCAPNNFGGPNSAQSYLREMAIADGLLSPRRCLRFKPAERLRHYQPFDPIR